MPARPLTVLDACAGACSSWVLHDTAGYIDATLSAKGETHPNSTVYDDIGVNSPAANAFLASVNLPYDPMLVGEPPRPPVYFDTYPYYYDSLFSQTPADVSTCNYVTNEIAHNIAANGTGIAMQEFPLGIDEQNVTQTLFVTFKTQVLLDALNLLGIGLGSNLVAGVYMEYSAANDTVRIFGTAIGVMVFQVNGTYENADGAAALLQHDQPRARPRGD